MTTTASWLVNQWKKRFIKWSDPKEKRKKKA
jgi:hypothetical protein